MFTIVVFRSNKWLHEATGAALPTDAFSRCTHKVSTDFVRVTVDVASSQGEFEQHTLGHVTSYFDITASIGDRETIECW